MPWVLLFVVAPLVLHGPSRRALPPNTRTHLSTWVARNPVIRSGFAERARALSPQVKDGVRYGVRCGALILAGQSIRGRSPSQATGQVGRTVECRPACRKVVGQARSGRNRIRTVWNFSLVQLLAIVLYSLWGDRRVVSLRPGQLNVITGQSK